MIFSVFLFFCCSYGQIRIRSSRGRGRGRGSRGRGSRGRGRGDLYKRGPDGKPSMAELLAH